MKTPTVKFIKLPPEYALGFDPMDPDAPGEGDGLPVIRHTVYDCIELCSDDLPAGLLLFKMIFLCRKSRIMTAGKRWYVRSRGSLCSETRLTRHQYDRALKILKKNGFVETRRVPFSKMAIFGNATMFRVTLNAIEGVKKILDLPGTKASKKSAK